jgi:tRNA A37 methylthiotransferase MiaB
VPPPVVKARAQQLRASGEEKMKKFRRSQVGRVLCVLTLRSDEDSLEMTPALSSNYLQVRVQRKFAVNEWVDVVIAEREEKIVGETVSFSSASAA